MAPEQKPETGRAERDGGPCRSEASECFDIVADFRTDHGVCLMGLREELPGREHGSKDGGAG